MLKLSISILLLMNTCKLMAQVDSLLRQIDGLDNLKTANAYINLSDYYLGKNSDSLFYYGLKAYDASKLIANDTIQERAILNMGSGMFYIQNYDSALHYYNQIIENETVGDNYIFAKALSNKGIIFYYQGDYANALVYFLKSAEFREENDLDVSIIYSQLAVIYQQTEDYDKAKKAYKKSYQESLVNKEMNSSLSNLASLFVKLKEYDSALFYSQKSLKYYRKNNADSKESHALGLIGYALLKLNNYERALSYFDSAIVLSQKINLPQRIAEQYSYSAQALIALGEYYPALEKLDSARIWSDNPLILRDIAQYKSEVYTLIGKIQPSFNSYKEYIAIRDSLNRVEKYEQVAELEKKYETQKKEQKIELLERDAELLDLRFQQQRQLFILIGIALLLLLIIFYFYFKSRNLKLSQQRLMIEQRLLRSQMNPHFVFNVMSAIQNFVYQKAEPVTIADYMGKFSLLTRMILDYSREELISLEKEIDFIQKYIELQQLRFDTPFRFKLNVDESLNLNSTFLPPILTQPFIENAIEHGILTKQGTGEININFSLTDSEMLEIEITDNGIGREEASFQKRNKEHRSLSTKITEERLTIFSNKSSFSMEDNMKEGKLVGTKVKIKLPIRQSAI